MGTFPTVQPIEAQQDSKDVVASRADLRGREPLDGEPVGITLAKTPPSQIFVTVLGLIAFLYFARPVVLPVFLASVAAMTLKPLIRWSSSCHIPPSFSAAALLCLLVAGVGIGFVQLGRPALGWVNNAPQHMTELRQRVQKLLPPGARFSEAAAAVSDLGATEAEKRDEQKKLPWSRSEKTGAPPR